jgi:hypothetical protein
VSIFFFRSLDETNRQVYHENAQLIDTIRAYKQQVDEFKKFEEQINRQIAAGRNEKELNEILVKDKLEQIQKQNQLIQQARQR